MFLISWVFLLRPTTLGGPAAYIIVSGKSMEPTLYTGDLAITRTQTDYKIGDLVAFPVEGGVVIHRISAERPEGEFKTRGDGNTWIDPWTVSSQDIIGRHWLNISGGGKFLLNILGSLRQPLLLGLYALLLTILLLVSGDILFKPKRTRIALRNQRRQYFQNVRRKFWL